MAEYVRHEVNGLLFAHRAPATLARARCSASWTTPALARSSARAATSIARAATSPTSREHVHEIEALYARVTAARAARGPLEAGPLADHLRHQPRRLQPALHDVRGALPHSPLQQERRAPEPAPGMPRRAAAPVMLEAGRDTGSARSSRRPWASRCSTSTSTRSSTCAGARAALNLTTNGTFPAARREGGPSGSSPSPPT